MQSHARHFILGFSLIIGNAAFAQHEHGAHTPAPAPKAPALYATDVSGLPEVTPSAEITLADGERFELLAAPAKQNVGGQWIRRLAYNGSVPGPSFRVKQGSRVTIVLKNSTDIATTLHPHGLRVAAQFDGVPGVGQQAIQPGGSFEYQLNFPDAGVYWYHPHVREDYSQDAGLYGLFIVEPADASTFNPVHREVGLILDDILLDPKQAYKKDSVDHTLMGRFGNVNLVNGSVLPTMNFTQGEIVRFYVLNSSNTRVYALAIPGLQLKLVGGDNGLYEREEWVDRVVLGPGERTIVEARFGEVGTLDVMNAKPTDPSVLAHFAVVAGQTAELLGDFNSLRLRTAASAAIGEARQLFQAPLDKKIKMTLTMDHAQLPMDHGKMGGMDHGVMDSGLPKIEWDDDMPAMNQASNTKNVVWKFVDELSSQENMSIQWSFTQGQFVKIRFFNDPNSMHPMQHPVHFHGQRFLVAAMDGKVPANLSWKDTVLIPSGSTYDVLLEAANPGTWMTHCHISEHLEASMMFNITVGE